MSDQGPLGGPEERMSLDIRRTGAGSEPAVLILDEQLPDEGLAKASVFVSNDGLERGRLDSGSDILGDLWGAGVVRKGDILPEECWQRSHSGSCP